MSAQKKPDSERRDIQVHIYFNQSEMDELNSLCFKLNMPMAHVIREAIKDYAKEMLYD